MRRPHSGAAGADDRRTSPHPHMPTPPAPRRRASMRLAPAMLAAALPTLAADAAAQERPTRPVRVTTSVGLMAGVPGYGAGSGNVAGTLDARASFRATRRLAWTLGATYARTDDAEGWCTPGGGAAVVGPGCFSYDHEALLATLGLEYALHARPLGGDSLRLALTSDVGAGRYHVVRHGTVPGFPRSPTEWHGMGPFASLGLLVARPIGTRLDGVVAGRLVTHLWPLLLGVAPIPQPALSVGLRW